MLNNKGGILSFIFIVAAFAFILFLVAFSNSRGVQNSSDEMINVTYNDMNETLEIHSEYGKLFIYAAVFLILVALVVSLKVLI